jgi:hypothetical protein
MKGNKGLRGSKLNHRHLKTRRLPMKGGKIFKLCP